MFLMYVDESGDTGLQNSPTRYFALSGVVVHELRWHSVIDRIIDFRRRIRDLYGLKLREELHASPLINRPGTDLSRRIPKHKRLEIVRAFAKELASIGDLSIINILVNKIGKPATYDVFEAAWVALIQRLENTIRNRNFNGPANQDDCGLILPDRTDEKKLTLLLRRMRRWNPVSNQPQWGSGFRNLRLARLVEDPVFKDSEHSYLIQASDLAAYLLYQRIAPNKYMRKKGARTLFHVLDPILCKVASTAHPQGVVRL